MMILINSRIADNVIPTAAHSKKSIFIKQNNWGHVILGGVFMGTCPWAARRFREWQIMSGRRGRKAAKLRFSRNCRLSLFFLTDVTTAY